MGEVFLYNHGGSANHGCEALVRTVCNLLSDNRKLEYYRNHHNRIYIMTYRK